MVKTKEEIMNLLKERFGEDTSDEVIGCIEDISDTLDDYETRTADNTDWKHKYEENDAHWRQTYKERFFDGSAKDEESGDAYEEPPQMKTKFEELFTTQ